MPRPRLRQFAPVVLSVILTTVPLAACAYDGTAKPSPSAGTDDTNRIGTPDRTDAAFKEIERSFKARLGVYAVDTGTGREVAYRDEERFAYASTIKALLAGVVLRERNLDGMQKRVAYSKSDLMPHSPQTEQHVTDGMTLAELSAAAMHHSDNTAANLLFDEIGGPGALQRALRQAGDQVTRSDRRETDLNSWEPGEERDTSTPRALAESLRAFTLGDELDEPEREQLVRWLKTNPSGAELIRKGMPRDWQVGDKSGGGGLFGARNDIAVIWRPDASPIVVAVMSNRRTSTAEYDDKLIAEAASVVASHLR
ncbi:class A beta-lactamase [Streptomyces sp. O3]